jgi:hypothetical protein
MEYRGGTYLAQVEAANETTALIAWAQDLRTSEIAGFGQKRKQQLIKFIEEDVKDDPPTPIRDLVNVWCSCARSSGGFILLTITATVADSRCER